MGVFDNIKDKAEALVAEAKEKAAEAIDKAEELAGEAKEKAAEALDKAGDLAGEAKGKAAEFAGDAKENFDKVSDVVKDKVGDVIDKVKGDDNTPAAPGA